MVWQSRKGSGKVDETTRYAALTAGDGIKITAAMGVAAEIHTGGASLADTVAALAQKPDTAWIAQVAKRDDVTWKRVQELHDNWDYKSQGLSGPASVVIAIAVAIATQGAGAGLLGAALGEGALTGAGGAMASAAFTSLVTQASLSLINNQGNLGAVLKDLGSSSALKSLAVSVASAGALSEVGTLTDGHFGANGLTTGDNLTPTQYFASSDYVLNVAGHAAVGCAAGAASGGDCGAGAVSGAASGAAGPFYVDSGVWGGTALAAATGGISSAAAGGEFTDGAVIGATGFLFNDVLLLNDSQGALNNGHQAIAIGDEKNGWHYYSKDGPELFTDGNQHIYYKSIDDIMAANPRYEETLQIYTSSDQDIMMKGYADTLYDKRYDFRTNNCADFTTQVMAFGGIDAAGDKTTFGITTPNKVMELYVYDYANNGSATVVEK
jgi:hypothetical protein